MFTCPLLLRKTLRQNFSVCVKIWNWQLISKNIRSYYRLSLFMYHVRFDNEIVLLCRRVIKTRSAPIGDHLDVFRLVVSKRVMDEEM